MYRNSFLCFCQKKKKDPYKFYIFKISWVRPTVTHNVYTKFKLNRMHRLDTIMFTHIHTHQIHAYITVKITLINSGYLKMYIYVKMSKSDFFMITILSSHNICSESKNPKNNCSWRKNTRACKKMTNVENASLQKCINVLKGNVERVKAFKFIVSTQKHFSLF